MSDRDAAAAFSRLHREGTFVLPNAWDGASAAVMAASGAAAIATTSSGVSWAAGIADGENLSRDEAIEAIARVTASVEVPVTADIESGYGSSPAEVATTLAAVIDTGAVGVNIEDRDWDRADGLRPVEEQCERLAAAREAAPRPFVINARCDAYLAGIGDAGGEREELVLGRAARYREAGADCIFIPGLTDIGAVARVVERAAMPVNVLLAAGRGPAIGELRAAGVRRISVGHALAATAYTAVREATEAVLEDDDAPLRGALGPGEMHALLSGRAGGGR